MHYLTPEGLQQLEKRLEFLMTVRRAEIAERLRVAMEESGELVENADYEDAKNEQAFVEGEVMRLQTILSEAELIQTPAASDIVAIGARVTVIEKGFDDEECYQIVGAAEANPAQGRISIDSPVGQALIGAKVGDKVRVRTPGGETVFKIKAIG